LTLTWQLLCRVLFRYFASASSLGAFAQVNMAFKIGRVRRQNLEVPLAAKLTGN